ncbi:MAG: MlaE family lipid ABC transporter permease subunit [Candidatus Eiseniibacteriota bacterium]
MTAEQGWFEATQAGGGWVVKVGGRWDVRTVERLEAELRSVGFSRGVATGGHAQALIDLGALDALDTAGAWLIQRTLHALTRAGTTPRLENVRPAHAALLQRVSEAMAKPRFLPVLPSPLVALIANFGRTTIEAFAKGRDLVAFYGLTLVVTMRILLSPRHIRWTALISNMEQVGLGAMPIVGLLSFLIGVVVAYQGADQLRQFGAEVFTVNLLGVSILRELGILITAIVVAGRSGSAFTAQIGTMKVNQEIDAMQTLGLDPVEILVLPRLTALVICLPLLAFYADMMALLGGAIMSLLALDISISQFVKQLQGAIKLTTFMVGMVKAPVFAFLIALVGCFEGLNVEGSAESVGRQTTLSVVEAIFLVIIFDAAFSIMFSYLRI